MPPTSEKSTILIVDDAPENIDALNGLLNEQYSIQAAANGQKGLDIIFSDRPPDLVLLDLLMPDMNGFEVCKKIKASHKRKEIPIIFITSLDTVDNKIRGFNAGAVDYIIKPFDPMEVMARVKTHVELKHARETIRKHNKQLEALLEQRTKELIQTERQAAFGQLVQGIVHNLRGPLTASLGASQLLSWALRDYDDLKKTDSGIEEELMLLRKIKSESDKACDIVEKSSLKLDEMLNSLLVKSRTDKINDMKILDLNNILEAEIDFLHADLRFKHGIEKRFQFSSQTLPIQVVPAEIAQVIHNIVGNALDALHNTSDPELIIRTKKQDKHAILEISDNGPGIPKHTITKIFDPFFTTKRPREIQEEGSNNPVGTGLGLWMCRDTLESYNGHIEVESREGKGATFRIVLPLFSDGK